MWGFVADFAVQVPLYLFFAPPVGTLSQPVQFSTLAQAVQLPVRRADSVSPL